MWLDWLSEFPESYPVPCWSNGVKVATTADPHRDAYIVVGLFGLLTLAGLVCMAIGWRRLSKDKRTNLCDEIWNNGCFSFCFLITCLIVVMGALLGYGVQYKTYRRGTCTDYNGGQYTLQTSFNGAWRRVFENSPHPDLPATCWLRQGEEVTFFNPAYTLIIVGVLAIILWTVSICGWVRMCRPHRSQKSVLPS
ncbi:Hypothetical protein POVN_LOCUS607 [uncultured virus]|nr:Hypothetical protein POVN_LOCUS607 [uncultured virus]